MLREIDTQGVENFASFRSEKFPGVAFSYTKFTVTPELIQELSTQKVREGIPQEHRVKSGENAMPEKTEGKEDRMEAKRHDYFLFTAFSPPPDGHAFTVQDVGIDRYIRLIPRVAAALSRGEAPPEVNVYLLGAPTGLGGSVTPEWVESIKKSGFERYGELYAEFVENHEA